MTSTQFELRDQDSVLFTGKLSYIAMIWDTNFLADEYFNKKYGSPRNPTYIINSWRGALEVVQVIERLDYPRDQIHDTWITTPSK